MLIITRNIIYLMLTSSCIQCSFGAFCLNKAQINIIKKERRLKKNELLHTDNQPFDHLYAIQCGALKTYSIDPMGNELIHGIYLKNEIYGYDAIYKKHHLFSAEALSETVVCEISYSSFLELLQKKPELLHLILYRMSQQLTFGAYLKFITAPQRLAAFILDISTRLLTEQSQSRFLLPMTYQDIGNYLGLATETISRILSQFKKNRIITIERKYIHILQTQLLTHIADGFK